jgi:clan AA aspartic protease (TIGR02281 family)
MPKFPVLAFAAVATLAVPSAANAFSLRCSAPTVDVGNADPGSNPVVSASVWLDGGIGGTWRVEYQLADGQLVNRRDQYPNMTDVSTKGSFTWVGNYRDNPNVRMIGEVLWNMVGTYSYRERILDDANGGQVTVDMAAECIRLDGQTSPAPGAPSASSPTSSADAAIELRCSAPTLLVGQDATRPEYRVVRTDVFHSENAHTWEIRHYLSGGAVVSRDVQYALSDTSSDGHTQWVGLLNRNPKLRMVGELQKDGNSNIHYDEWLYDDAQGGKLVFSASSACQRTDAPQTQVAQSNPRATGPSSSLPSPSDSVPIYPSANGRAVYVDVQLGSRSVRMLIDTGATGVTVVRKMALALVADNEAELLPQTGTAQLADGSVREQEYVRITSLIIGGHTLSNVIAGVTPDGADMLLGFPVLNRVGRFTIDTNSNRLIFG